MKITQSQLRQIIKEELSNIVSEDSASDQMTIDKVKKVTELWNELYNSLLLPPRKMQSMSGKRIDAPREPDNEARELFEVWLNKNLKAYTEMWQRDRNEPLEREKEREQFQREEEEFGFGEEG